MNANKVLKLAKIRACTLYIKSPKMVSRFRKTAFSYLLSNAANYEPKAGFGSVSLAVMGSILKYMYLK